MAYTKLAQDIAPGDVISYGNRPATVEIVERLGIGGIYFRLSIGIAITVSPDASVLMADSTEQPLDDVWKRGWD